MPLFSQWWEIMLSQHYSIYLGVRDLTSHYKKIKVKNKIKWGGYYTLQACSGHYFLDITDEFQSEMGHCIHCSVRSPPINQMEVWGGIINHFIWTKIFTIVKYRGFLDDCNLQLEGSKIYIGLFSNRKYFLKLKD